MRIKKFTLLTLALLLMSVVAFAQKPSIPQLLQKRTATSVLPNSQKAPTPLNFNFPAKSGVAKAPNKAAMLDYWTLAGTYYYSGSTYNFEQVVEVQFVDDQVTINSFSPLVGGSITGTLDGNTITFASPQYLGDMTGGGDLVYFFAYDLNTSSMVESVTAEYGEDGITFPEDIRIYDNSKEDRLYYYGFWYNLSIVSGTEPDPVTPPAGLETAEYRLNAYAYDANGDDMGEYSLPILIGWDNNDVWVQGLCQDFPEAWIKGTFADGSVTFAKGQKFDEYKMSGYGTIKDFFAGYDIEEYEMADVTMSFDQETGLFTMTSPYLMIINAYWALFNPNLLFEDVSFVPVPDEAATPAQPEITSATVNGSNPIIKVNIPMEDVDGNPILTGKLYYKYYYDVEREVSPLILSATKYGTLLGNEEDIEEIPYNLADASGLISNDHFYLWLEDCSNWNKVGIQSVYYGGDEENETGIFWYTIKPYENQHDIVFTPAEESDGTIQDGQAKVFIIGQDVNGNDIYEDATERVDAHGKLASIDENLNVVLTPINGFKLANVTASYKEQAAGGGAGGTVTIGDLEEATNNSYLPMNSLYNYSYSQQIYTAEEIGQAGTISAITVWLYGNENLLETPYDIYMVETNKEAFESATDWITVAASDKVCTGTVTVHNTEAEAYTFVLDTPFEYSGTGNLVVCFLNKTGAWKSGLNGMVFGAATDPTRAIYFRNDNTLVDPTDPGVTATAITYVRNVMQIDFGTGGGASGELTVHDGSATNGYVPVYGFYADAYLKSEFVMPATELADMAGGKINSMKFYLSTPAQDPWASTFQVFLKEVAETEISAFSGTDGATVVYEGTLNGTDSEMEITFTTPYQYNGGNLLIGVYNITTGNYKSASFLGEQVTGASVQGYSYSSLNDVSPTQRNFIPKTTFTYTGGAAPTIVDIEVTQDENGGLASFTMPNAKVNVTYELARLGTPVEVAAGKYITYYTDKDIIIYDEDCELLTVTAVDETTVTATPLEVAAAETPLLIYNSGDDKKTVWVVPTEDTPYAAFYEPDEIEVAPEFKGTLEEKTFTAAEMNAAEHFICDGENFIWVRSEGTIAANKCWLELTNDEPLTARAIVIGAAETTGIADMNRETITNDRYYDLQGRRIMQPVKGLYISNGKKVMVK